MKHPRRTARALCTMALVASGCGGDASAGGADAGATADASVAPRDGAAPGACDEGRGDCTLDCDPNDTWLALTASGAGSASIRSLGDAEPASPEDVGDGMYHLFVGVADEAARPGSSCGASPGQQFLVRIYDAVSDRVDRDYAIGAVPIVTDTILYDRFGMETPAYLRVGDAEYLYYCGLYQSYDCMPKGKIQAFRRVGGGSWERVTHDVAPFGAGATSQCEPDVVRDPATGLFHLFFITDGDAVGTVVRTSADPELFAAGAERRVSPLGARPGVALDPFDRVWRASFNAYDADDAIQTWATSLDALEPATIVAHSAILHASRHALHPDVHLDAAASVSQSTTPVFPSASDVLFFYSGIGTSGELRVHAQQCRRRGS